MNFVPQKFFISLMDFFSILLPGALLTHLLRDDVGLVVLGKQYTDLTGAEAWAAFLFASYLFGHLIFLLGSWLDEFYDWARRYTLDAQIAMLTRRGHPLPWPARALLWLVFKCERNLAVDRVVKIKQQTLGAMQAEDSINAFQWCKALLNIESPKSLADSGFRRNTRGMGHDAWAAIEKAPTERLKGVKSKPVAEFVPDPCLARGRCPFSGLFRWNPYKKQRICTKQTLASNPVVIQ